MSKIILLFIILDTVYFTVSNIEHYYTDESSSVINEVLSKSFKIIRDFCIKYLEEEPIHLFGQKSWDIFLEVEESEVRMSTDKKRKI